MERYLTSSSYNGTGLKPVMDSVSSAIPLFWPLLLFVFWIAINGASYFAILKLTGKKRFFHTFLATSFVMFLSALVLSANNTAAIIYISGYWVAFYLMMTVVGWFLLSQYK